LTYATGIEQIIVTGLPAVDDPHKQPRGQQKAISGQWIET
jgi:hypothetical protein